jgi:predicted ATPase
LTASLTEADLVAMLKSLRREAHVTSLSFARLTEDDTIALLAQTADTAPCANRLSHWLYQETDGSPFFFTSLLQSMRDDGLLPAAGVAMVLWAVVKDKCPFATMVKSH